MVTCTKFDVAMTVVVILNILALTIEYYKQPIYIENISNLLSTMFVTVFALEICFKLIAMKQHFFRNMWNVFDLLLTILCIIGTRLEIYVNC